MSDHSDLGSSGLTDWALVNSQGELESSDVESNTSSIEVVGREVETEEEELGHSVPDQRETSPECFELEQLMRKADADVEAESTEKRIPEVTEAGAAVSQPATFRDDSSGTDASPPEQQPQEVTDACCLELLTSAERRQPAGEGEEKVAAVRQMSQESDSHTSSESILSLSGISSLSNTSKSSRADSDSESDFVRLEKESSSLSSHDSEEEEALSGPEVIAITTSESSVRPGFNFLSSTRASSEPPSLPQRPVQAPPPPPLPEQHHQEEEQEQLEPLPIHQAVLGEQPPPPPLPSPPPVQPAEPAPQPQQADRPPSPHEDAEVMVQHPLQLHQHPAAAAAAAAAMVVYDADDGDTESSTEDHDQDDRIESEQSDDTNAGQADDQDDLSLVNDLGDLPVERGDAERHYIHHNNQQLNGCLNRVMLAVVVLAVGMGLGHWIGSAREHFSQMEIQLAQMKRLHQMQDEYVQCLARNDELLLDYDNTLQGERDRHQEAMVDLRDNNRELQEQLQEAQDQLERILTAQAQDSRSSRNSGSGSNIPGRSSNPTLEDLNVLVTSKILVASETEFEAEASAWSEEFRQAFRQVRQSFAKRMEERWRGNEIRQSVGQQQEADHQGLLLQQARQQINNLKNENAELRVSVGKMRYNVDSLSANSAPSLALSYPSSEEKEEEEEIEDMPLPPPPNPIPPPPLSRSLIPLHQLDEDLPDDYTVEVEGEGDKYYQGDILEKPTLDAPERKIRHPKPVVNTDSPQTVPVDVTLLQRNLTQERHRADMWRRLYLSARAENRKEQPINSSACLHFLSQQMNMSAFMNYVMHWNLTGAGGTGDFADLSSLVSSIIKLQRNLVHALPSLWAEFSSTIHSFHSDDEDDRDAGSDNSAEEDPDADSRGEESHQSKWSDGVKQLLNKTRGTLSNVSQQLQQTWSQVKDASRQLWPDDDSVLGRMASRVKEGVSKLSHKVKKKASRWFKKRSKADKKGHKKRGSKTFQEEHASEKTPKKRDDGQAAKQPGKLKPLGKSERKNKKKIDHHNDRKVEEEELQKKKEKAGRHQHKNTEMKQDKKAKKYDRHNKAEVRPGKHHHKDAHGQNGKRQNKHGDDKLRSRDGKKWKRLNKHQRKESESAEDYQKGPHEGKKDKVFNQPSKDKARHQKHLSEDLPGGAGKQAKFDQPAKERAKPDGKSAEDSPSKEDHHRKDGPQSMETEFHTKAKDHSSHAEKAAAKAKFRLEKRFQNLFSGIGSMGKLGFNHLDEDDISEMIKKTGAIYDDSSSLGLPESGRYWLKCQFYWWVKAHWWVDAWPKHMLYLPSENCLQYLAPWQLDFMEETKAKLESGECQRKRIISCMDPPPEDEEDYYEYVCVGNEGYDRSQLDNIAKKSVKGDHDKNTIKEANHSPKGTRENEPRSQDVPKDMPNTQAEEEISKHSAQQVNQTEEDSAWYFKWVQGRDSLRTVEHKADWVFERAADREESRQREHSADWVFERAADRDEHRENDDEEEDEEEEEERFGHWKDKQRDWQKHGERGPHFKHKGRKHQHDRKEGHFKHHRRDFRQKYGRTSFCEFC
ncbi:titin homolog [Littorina saxatilis]|uniref:Uncharacterized protein n=1 Tax=Littorina saxatilis TaxID=31220 RepID=A0AAN9GPL2_9CAEN